MRLKIPASLFHPSCLRSRSFQVTLFFLLFFLLFLFLELPGWAETMDPETIRFERMGILPPVDRSGGSMGPQLEGLIWFELEHRIRFNALFTKVSGADPGSGKRKIRKLARKGGLDALITSFAELEGERVRLGISLFNGKTGGVFAREFVSFKKNGKSGIMEKAVEDLVQKLLSRIPYNGWVIDVSQQGRSIKVNSGPFHGLGKGATVELFSLSELNMNTLTGEFVGAREEKVGELKIVGEDNFTATARIIQLERGKTISGGEFFRFKPSRAVLSRVAGEKQQALKRKGRPELEGAGRKEMKKAARETKKLEKESSPSRGNLYFYIGPGWARTSLHSTSLDIERKTSAFPRIKAGGDYWFFPRFGAGVDLGLGKIKFDKVNSAAIDESARVFSGGVVLNLLFTGPEDRSSRAVIGRVGFQRFGYQFSSTDNQFLVDTRYSGPLLGLELRVPLAARLRVRAGGNYFPQNRVFEDPVESGEDPSSKGGEAFLEGHFYLGKAVWFSMRYEYIAFFTDFSGVGNRAGGLSEAKNKDVLHSLLFGVSLDF